MKPIADVVTTIGKTNGRHPQKVFGIRQADRLYHCAIFGMTGTGKSTLIRSMMDSDKRNRMGFCLIDPHGDLAKSMAETCGNECIYWNIADPACRYGYNPLTFVNSEYRPLVASGLIDTLKKQWGDSAWGPRMEHLLRYVLLALLERPNSTLLDIMPMFLSKGFRYSVLRNVTDPVVKRFWFEEYNAMNFKNAADGVAPIANKLGAFLAHPMVRKAVCEPEMPLRFRQIMDQGKILIINLAKGRLGADVANVLGGLIFSNLVNAALSRENIPEDKRQIFHIYGDEIQSFSSDVIADILTELRKYRVSLTAVSQMTSRLSANVLEAIMGNVGTLISFRVGASDATRLYKQLAPDTIRERDLINLANYKMYIKQMGSKNTISVFSAQCVCNNP